MPLAPGWITTQSDNGTITVSRDPKIQEQTDKSRAAVQDTRNKLTDLYNSVGSVYTGLVNSGRQEEAASLKDAAERFARAGSQTGVSSDARVASLQELAGKLRVAGQTAEGNIQAQGINQTLDILKTLANLDQNVLNDSFKEAYSSSSSSSVSPTISGARNVRVKSTNTAQRPEIRRSPTMTASSRSSGLDGMAQRSWIANAIDKYQREAEQSNSRALNGSLGGGVQGMSPGTVGNYASAQAALGQKPGLFQSGPAAAKPASFFNSGVANSSARAPAAAPLAPGYNADGGYNAPLGGPSMKNVEVLPSYGSANTRPVASPTAGMSNKPFDWKRDGFSAKYKINPITGKRTLIASGNK